VIWRTRASTAIGLTHYVYNSDCKHASGNSVLRMRLVAAGRAVRGVHWRMPALGCIARAPQCPFRLHPRLARLFAHAARTSHGPRTRRGLVACSAGGKSAPPRYPRLLARLGGGVLLALGVVALAPAILSTSLGLRAALAAYNVRAPTRVTVAEVRCPGPDPAVARPPARPVLAPFTPALPLTPSHVSWFRLTRLLLLHMKVCISAQVVPLCSACKKELLNFRWTA